MKWVTRARPKTCGCRKRVRVAFERMRCSFRCAGAGCGRVEVDFAGVRLAVVVVQAAWRYSLMSPLQVVCRRIGWPVRYSTTSFLFGAR